MKKTFLPLLSLVTAAALLTGCQSGGPYAPKPLAQPELEDSLIVVLMDKRVQNSIGCSGAQATTLADGRLDVNARLRNRETRRIQVQVQCVFKDALGHPTGDETPWENLHLTENAQEQVHFVSMNDRAKRFTIRVREAH
ncbi:MAG: DUF1425 domain-containing protein [Verrucomicrobia bacterium]|nr:DUF1425 domain-containing protein [Verrucomicrobiota bacterium]